MGNIETVPLPHGVEEKTHPSGSRSGGMSYSQPNGHLVLNRHPGRLRYPPTPQLSQPQPLSHSFKTPSLPPTLVGTAGSLTSASTTQLFGNQPTQTVDNLFQLQIDGLSLQNEGENDDNEAEPDSDEEASSSLKLEENEHHPSLFGLAHTQSSPLLHSHVPNPIPSSSSTSALQTNHTPPSPHAFYATPSENNNQLLTPAGGCALHDSGAYDSPCVVCVAAPKLFPFPKPPLFNHNKPATATIISKASSNGPRKIGPFPVLNNQSAQWQQDNTAIYCGLCRKTFAVLVRRHHCRRCGRCICSGCSLVLRSPVPLRLCIQCLQGTTATQKIDLMTRNGDDSTNKLDNGNGNENTQRLPEVTTRSSSIESEQHPPKVVSSSPQLGVRTLPITKAFERRHTEYPPHSRRKDEVKEKFRHSHQPRSGSKKTRPLSSSDPRGESAMEVFGMAAPRWEPNHPTFSHSVTHDTDTADGFIGEQSDISPSVEMDEHLSKEERHNQLLDIIESRTFDQDLYQQYQQRESSPTLQHPSIVGRIETSADASSYFSSMMMYQVDPNPTSSYQVVASQTNSECSNPPHHHHHHQEHRYACDLAGISIEKAQMEIQRKEKEVPTSLASNYIEDYNDLTEMLQQSTSPPETVTSPSTVPQQPISIDHRQRRAIKISDKIMDEDDFHWSTEWVETAKEGGATNARARALYHEFAQAAQATVKVIVSELNLPEERKTYRPIDVGGVAGGVKVISGEFLVNGMFFKLSTDSSNLYGGTQWAMKAANHEIKGLRAYLSCGIQELLIPMAALFDYLGFRVLAFSLLPINRSTLIYGSSNAGKTAKTDPEFEKVMKSAAEKLNLKCHIVAGTRLWSAADIEGHRSVNGKLYIIDCARAFPPEPISAVCMAAFIPQDMDSPIQEIELERHNMEEGIRALLSPPSIHEAKQLREHYILKHKNVGEFVLFFFEKKPYAPVSIATFDTINFRASQIGLQPLRGDAVLLSGIKNPHLCLLMRSELVALSPTPLSPDAFSLFNQSDPEAVSHNNEVIAGYKLINRQIELLAHRLLIGEEIPLHSEELSRCLHSYGINMRYLGKLRNFVRSSYRISALLLNEIVARVCKHFIREKLRLVQSPSLEEYQNVVANYFNVIFGSSEISNIYWCILLKGLVWLKYGAYGEPLTSRERRESFDFRKEEYYRPYALFLTLQMQTGVRLSSANEARRWFREGKTPIFLGKDVSFSVKQKSFFEKEPLGEAFQKSILAETSSPSILLRIQTISENLPLSARIHLAFNFATNYELALTGEPVKMIKLLWKNIDPKECPVEIVTAIHTILGCYYHSLGYYDLAEQKLRYARRQMDSIAGDLGHPSSLMITDFLARSLVAQGKEDEIGFFVNQFLKVWDEFPINGEDKLREIFFARQTPTVIEYHLNRLEMGDAERQKLISLNRQKYFSLKPSPATRIYWKLKTKQSLETLSGLSIDISPLRDYLLGLEILPPATQRPTPPSPFQEGEVLLWGQFGPCNRELLRSKIDLGVAGSKVIATAAGADVAFLVTEFNAVFCLGKKSPALGISAQRDVFEKPQLIRGLQGKRIIRVACSAYKKPHVLALSAEGSLYSFGSNRRGQLGVGDKVKRTTPVRVHLPQDASIIHMSCGDEHSVALGKKGKLYGWGSNHFGEISLSGRDVLDPEIIDTHQEIVLSSSAVKYATTYITKSGLWYRGSFRMKSNQTVRTHPLSPKVFPPVSGSDPFYRVVGQLAITASGQVFAFGWDNVGELGMSQPGDCIISPKRPYDLREEQVLYISTSGHQSYFITAKGDVWMCGFVPSETPEGTTSQGQTPASSFSSYSSLSANPPGFGLTSSVYNSHFSRDSTFVASIADLHNASSSNSNIKISGSNYLPNCKKILRRVAPVKINNEGIIFSEINTGKRFAIGIVGTPAPLQPIPELVTLFQTSPSRYIEPELSLWQFEKHRIKFTLPSGYKQQEVFPAGANFETESETRIQYRHHAFSNSNNVQIANPNAESVDIFAYPELQGSFEYITQKRGEALSLTIHTDSESYSWEFTSPKLGLNSPWWRPALDAIVFSFNYNPPDERSGL